MEQITTRNKDFRFINPGPEDILRLFSSEWNQRAEVIYSQSSIYDGKPSETTLFAGNVGRIQQYAEDIIEGMIDHSERRNPKTVVTLTIRK